MDQAHATLWDRIAAFPLDEPGADWTFTQRLARENRWSGEFAGRVIEEYRRFLLLAMAAGHPVTPSDGVDQAWHLHLTYTRSYWDDLCGAVLGRPLHHGPTRGGAAESAKFHDWYARTLDSYRRLFDAEPPADIWPPAADRFGRDLHFERVNTATHWVVPRPATLLRGLAPARGPGLTAAALALILVVVVGCGRAALAPPAPLPDVAHMTGAAFLRLYVPLALFAVVLSIWARARAGGRHEWIADPDFADSASASETLAKLDPYALILLARGPQRTAPATAALVRVLGETVPEMSDRPAVRKPHPVEEAAGAAVRLYPKLPAWQLARITARDGALADLEGVLVASGLVRSAGEALIIRLAALVPLAPVLALGAWRIQLGMTRGRPVGFLALTCLALGLVALLHLGVRPWRTPRGAALVAAMGKRKDVAAVVAEAPSPSDPNFTLAFAMLGLAALPDTESYTALRKQFAPASDGGGGGGCGGGGGSGGDGGGGGCGGSGCGGGGCGGCGGG
jgi:uncharacterized protein (TIGR04222 family)